MKKIMFVFGTRPEAIKMAPLVKAMEQAEDLEPLVVVTAQHREMLDQVLELFDVHPSYDLNLMKPQQTLTDITAGVLRGIERIVIKEKPFLSAGASGACGSRFAQRQHVFSVSRRSQPQADRRHGNCALCTNATGTCQSAA